MEATLPIWLEKAQSNREFWRNVLNAKKLQTKHHEMIKNRLNALTPAEMTEDEVMARLMIKGELEPEMVFQQIEYSEGFPIWTSRKTVIFMHNLAGSRWSVEGDFSDWKPIPMKRTKCGRISYVEIPVEEFKNDGLGYKFVRRDGETFADTHARHFNYDANGEISLLKRPQNTQFLMRWNNFESPQGLKPRPIHVLVPACDGPYDVLYTHDGQNLFANDSICGGWKLCQNMHKVKGNFLIVGIWNTIDRMSEYTHVEDTDEDGYHATLGSKYADFVEHTVRPFIESRFETTPKAGLMGSSLGGLISLYISNRFPGRYAAVLALSPTTAWGRFADDHGVTIRDYYEQAGHQNTFLYIDHGGEFPAGGQPAVLDHTVAVRDESEWASAYDNCCYTFDFVSALVEIGYRQNIDMFYQHIHGALHNEVAWAERVCKPLRLFMKV